MFAITVDVVVICGNDRRGYAHCVCDIFIFRLLRAEYYILHVVVIFPDPILWSMSTRLLASKLRVIPQFQLGDYFNYNVNTMMEAKSKSKLWTVASE